MVSLTTHSFEFEEQFGHLRPNNHFADVFLVSSGFFSDRLRPRNYLISLFIVEAREDREGILPGYWPLCVVKVGQEFKD